jgi:hypothetical protein
MVAGPPTHPLDLRSWWAGLLRRPTSHPLDLRSWWAGLLRRPTSHPLDLRSWWAVLCPRAAVRPSSNLPAIMWPVYIDSCFDATLILDMPFLPPIPFNCLYPISMGWPVAWGTKSLFLYLHSVHLHLPPLPTIHNSPSFTRFGGLFSDVASTHSRLASFFDCCMHATTIDRAGGLCSSV